MGIVSRLLLNHPDLGEEGGTALHTKVETLFTKIGDNTNARYFTEDALADAASVDFQHNFKCAFNDLRFDLYTRDGADELTEVTDLSNWVIEATPGNVTTQIRVTNNTGGALDISLAVIQDPIGLAELTNVDLSTGLADGRVLTYESSSETWKPQVVPSAQPAWISKAVGDAGYTATANEHIFGNTTGGAFQINLPATPTAGDTVEFLDSHQQWGTNNLTVGRNTNNINGAANNFTCDASASGIFFTYVDGTQGWRTRQYV